MPVPLLSLPANKQGTPLILHYVTLSCIMVLYAALVLHGCFVVAAALFPVSPFTMAHEQQKTATPCYLAILD